MKKNYGGLGGGSVERYSRQIVLPQVGIAGQERLGCGRVLVVGAGGLGSPAALYLAAAGVGVIGVADSDSVEISNLQRQILHSEAVLGVPKVESAAKTLGVLNSGVTVVPYHARVDADNIEEIIRDKEYDFIIDAADNFTTKFLINDVCVRLGKPFAHGGVKGFGGQVLTFIPGKGPCYRCVFGGPPGGAASAGVEGTVGANGIIGPVCGIAGSIQAAEATKFLLGLECLAGVLAFNALTMEFRTVKLARNTACAACGRP
jgi:molybdopterin/thiamine biosynthesis adenylyltransferase